MFFSIENEGVVRLQNRLEKLREKSIPFAIRNTLNAVAFDTRKQAIDNIENSMITRNKWTARSVMVERATGYDANTMASRVGSMADYMKTQEFGGSVSNPTIATSYSAGQDGQKPRTKLSTKPNKLRNIQLRRKSGAGSRRQRNAVAVKEAAASGNKYVFLDLGRRQGIFKVLGGKRAPRVKMVHDTGRKSVAIRSRPWLSPATATASRGIMAHYERSLNFQLSRLSR